MGKVLLGNIKGPKGDEGIRGSKWLQGTNITGTSTEETTFPDSGIEDSLINDSYLNTSTGDTYRCTFSGDANTAKWVYTGNIKGLKGDKGDTQTVENAIINFTDSDIRENISSTDTIGKIFGKIKKWFSDLGTAAFCGIANNDTTTEPGFVWDARRGKALRDDITALNSATVKRREYYEGLGNMVYNSLGACAGVGADEYYKIHIPGTESVYSMFTIEMTMRQDYDTMLCGKILLNLCHGINGNFLDYRSNCTVFGSFNKSLKIYVDGGSDIYVKSTQAYGALSVDKILAGDNVVWQDISGLTMDRAVSLPSTAVEVPVKFAVAEDANSNILNQVNDINNFLNFGKGLELRVITLKSTSTTKSHWQLIEDNWSKIFKTYTGFVLVTTEFANKQAWLLWAYGDEGAYGCALRMGYDIAPPTYHRIQNNVWLDAVNL